MNLHLKKLYGKVRCETSSRRSFFSISKSKESGQKVQPSGTFYKLETRKSIIFNVNHCISLNFQARKLKQVGVRPRKIFETWKEEDRLPWRKSLSPEDNFCGKLKKIWTFLYIVLNQNQFYKHPINPIVVISFQYLSYLSAINSTKFHQSIC